MTIFEAIQEVRRYEQEHLPFMETIVDRDILAAIGFAQDNDSGGIYLKQLLLLGISSFATVNRRVTRLVRSGAVAKQRSQLDHRVQYLKLTDQAKAAFELYADMLPRAFNRRLAQRNTAPGHRGGTPAASG